MKTHWLVALAASALLSVGCGGEDPAPTAGPSTPDAGLVTETDSGTIVEEDSGLPPVGQEDAGSSGQEDASVVVPEDAGAPPVDPCIYLNCGTHGECVASGKTAQCKCDAGYAGTSCGECASGYQDNDKDGVCTPNCAASGLACGAHGSCTDASGTPACKCAQGYAGASCNQCATGYQDKDGDGLCKPDCATANLSCGAHGTCSDASGTALCACDTGYMGTTCKTCASGYQDNDKDGVCSPNCTTASLDCGGHGSCSVTSGTATCACNTGYAGANCKSCAAGYQDKDGDGVCKPTCATAGLTCGGHGSCSDASGTATCTCDTGYKGANCTSCASGYQDNDSNGTCTPNCSTSGLAGCSGHGTCSHSSGTATCSCNTGYTGTNCSSCASGYQDSDGDGVCKPTCATANLSCGNHGTCSHSSGTATCVCGTGYTGTNCASCASGYQDNDSNGTCTPTCTTAGLTCGGHGTCSHSSGTATCTCSTGYTGTNCTSCASGYQDNDGDGTCKPNCATAGLTCSSTQKCDDASGTAQCVTDHNANAQEWTFMVYLDGDNNLSDSADADLQEMVDGMKAAGSASDKINVVVLYDGELSSDTAVYKVTRSGKSKLSTGTAIYSGSEADMSQADTLKKFGVWAVEKYPAKRYALVMWDHGSGWRDGETSDMDAAEMPARHCGGGISMMRKDIRKEAFRGFASDDHSSSGGSIYLSDGAYGTALSAIVAKAGQKMDLLGFDACLMGMYEVAAASASYGNYLVASSESEPGSGWDYKAILSYLGKTPTMNAVTLGTKAVDSYHASGYSSIYDYTTATLALYDLSKVPSLTTALNSFGSAMKSATSSYKSRIANVAGAVQRFGYHEHADLKHLATLTADSSYGLPSSVVTAANSLISALDSTVLHYAVNNSSLYWGYTHNNAYGMAIFFPESFDVCSYDGQCSIGGESCSHYSFSAYSCDDEDSGWYSAYTLTANGDYYKASNASTNGWSSKMGGVPEDLLQRLSLGR